MMEICPFCGFHGEFIVHPRGQQVCPSCRLAERTRLQWEAAKNAGLLSSEHSPFLHVSPEKLIEPTLRSIFPCYLTTDINPRNNRDITADLCDPPFREGLFGVVWASHVLEHIGDADAAIRSVFRILRPGGTAVLAVPLRHGITKKTNPNRGRHHHEWAPGRKDWSERYLNAGFVVEDLIPDFDRKIVPGLSLCRKPG